MKVGFDLANLKPGMVNYFLFLAFALVTIPTAKYFFAKFPIPGISQLAAAM